MSQQGDRSGHEDDWWAELYDPRRSDAGPAAAADSVDDRFDSAFRTLAGDRDTGDHRPAAGALWEPRAGDQGGAAPGSDADAGGGPQGWRSPDGEGPGAAPPSQGRAAGSGVVPSRTEPGVPWADSGSGVTSGGAGSGAASGGAGSGAASGGVGSGTASGAAGSGVASSRTEPGVPSGGAGSGATPGGADPRTALEGADSKTTPGGADPGAVPGRMGPGGARGRDGGRDGAQRGADPEAVAGRTEPGAAPGRAASPAPASATPPPPPRPATPPPRPATPPPRPATPPPPSAPPPSPRDAGPPAAPRRTPQADPSRPWRSAAAGYVGDGPPTYEAEPTTLPVADPEDLRDLVPDTVLEGARYGTLTLRAASLRGDSARYRGEPRRDALLAARFGTGDSALILVAVASGQRAAPGTHRAARELCEWIAEAVGRNRARLTEDVHTANRGALVSGLHRLTDRAYGRLRADATERGLAPADYTASVRCLLLPAHPACRTRVFFGMGDGGLFRLRDGVWQDLEPAETEPEPAPTSAPASAFTPAPASASAPAPASASAPAPASASTPASAPASASTPASAPASASTPAPAPASASTPASAPDPASAPAPASTSAPSPAPFRFRASVARPGDTLLLCSAGLADPLRGEAALADHLAERWGAAEPPGLSAFLADAQTGVKGYADDRTAVAVWEA
ncbi:protein phosphatase 2C domain-containing protein [Streptomyces hygroscopicus]|uniref:protein phosphatase 2C domain-containing protein n=1 Tax=Streptomyces hygroscopicus TaxID=1912 RepID=UPI003795DF11